MTTEGQGKPPSEGPSDPSPKSRPGPQLKVIVGGASSTPPEEQPAMPSTPTPLSDLGERVLQRIAGIVGAERAFLFIWNDEEFTLQLARRPPSKPDEKVVDPKGLWPLLDRVVAERRPLVMGLTEESAADVRVSGVTEQLRMGIAVPLLTDSGMAGVLCIDRRLSRGMFVESDVTVVNAAMDAFGIHAQGVHNLLEAAGAQALPSLQQSILAPVQGALVGAQVDNPPSEALITVDAEVLAPAGRFVDFWHRRVLSGDREQVLLARLCIKGEDVDDAARGVTACYRTLSQVSELGAIEVVRGMRSTLGALGGAAYWLGITVLQWDREEGRFDCWRAGDGAVLAEGPGGARVQMGALAPLDAECDELSESSWKAAAGDRVYCFAACGSGGVPDEGGQALAALNAASVSVLRVSLA